MWRPEGDEGRQVRSGQDEMKREKTILAKHLEGCNSYIKSFEDKYREIVKSEVLHWLFALPVTLNEGVGEDITEADR